MMKANRPNRTLAFTIRKNNKRIEKKQMKKGKMKEENRLTPPDSQFIGGL
jgi:hypothetical protein